MGACATKPLDPAHKKVPVEIHEENFTPRSAEATPTTTETAATAEDLDKLIDAVEEKTDEEKMVDASDSKPAPAEQKFDNIEKPVDATDADAKPSDVVEEKSDEEKPVDASDSKPTSPPEEQKFDTILKASEETSGKEKEAIKHEAAEAESKELKS